MMSWMAVSTSIPRVCSSSWPFAVRIPALLKTSTNSRHWTSARNRERFSISPRLLAGDFENLVRASQFSPTPKLKESPPSRCRRMSQYTAKRAPMVRWNSSSAERPLVVALASASPSIPTYRASSGKAATQSSKNCWQVYFLSRMCLAACLALVQSVRLPFIRSATTQLLLLSGRFSGCGAGTRRLESGSTTLVGRVSRMDFRMLSILLGISSSLTDFQV